MVESTIYEHLFGSYCCAHCEPSQHVVEHFDGDTLCTDRWQTACLIGTNTFRMADVICGGFEIVTGATTNAVGDISYSITARQFCPAGAILIAVASAITTNASANMSVGFDNNFTTCSGNDFVTAGICTTVSNFLIRNANPTVTKTCTCVAKDFDTFHNFKLEMTACDLELTLCGGCIDATTTTQRPNAKQHPIYSQQTITTSSRTGRIRYLEAFNT